MNDYQEQANLLYKGYALAPMVRASTTPLRILALKYGADFCYTEELVDRSLSSTIRVVNTELQTIDYIKDTSKLALKTRKKLQKQNMNNRPCLILRIDQRLEKAANKLICQLGTGEPELALPAAKHVCNDVSAIDVNMGCPKKFSVSGGMGSALLKDPNRASNIIKTLRQEIPKPISCKIRLLDNTQQTLDYVEAMINSGVNAIAIHSRRVGQESTEPADWKTLEEVMSLLRPKYPTFPFLINGDFYDRKETSDMIEKTKTNGALLGRPALYNTSIFRKLPSKLEDKTVIVQEYLKLSKHYDTHFKNAKYVICEMMSNRRTPANRVPYMPIKFPNGQTIGKTCDCKSLESLFQLWNVQWTTTTTTTTKPDSAALGTSQSPFSTTTTTTTTTTLAAGEHQYLDSYVKQRLGSNISDVVGGNDDDDDEPDAKRIKIMTNKANDNDNNNKSSLPKNEEEKKDSEERKDESSCKKNQ